MEQPTTHDTPQARRLTGTALLALALALGSTGCVGSLVMNKAAGALSGAGASFASDDDPELVAEALPFALKTFESVLRSAPDNIDLLLATGSAFTMYAYAFVQFAADTLPDTRLAERAERLARAKKLYLRARRYLLHALDLRYPGSAAQLERGQADSALAATCVMDTALLYWAGAAWMGAFTTDKFDMNLTVAMPVAVALVRRSLALDERFGGGAAHEFLIAYCGSVPASMGGGEDLARKHFQRALEISRGHKAGPYVSLASSVAVAKQDITEFRELLAKALAVDLDADPGNRLANILNQRKARWLLAHTDDLFLGAGTGDSEQEVAP